MHCSLATSLPHAILGSATADPPRAPGPQTPNESTIPTACSAAASDAAVAPDNVRPVVPTRFPAPWLPHWCLHAIQHRVDITRHPVCVLLPARAHGAEQRQRHAPYGLWVRDDDPWVRGACMKMPIGVPWCGTLPTALGMGIASAGIGIVSTVLVIERPSLEPKPENSTFTVFANAVSTGLWHKPWRHLPWRRQRTCCPHVLLLPSPPLALATPQTTSTAAPSPLHALPFPSPECVVFPSANACAAFVGSIITTLMCTALPRSSTTWFSSTPSSANTSRTAPRPAHPCCAATHPRQRGCPWWCCVTGARCPHCRYPCA
ncbi:hypothetical protein K438DRAFT_773819 [Mycena galopus ATCC 62051]|nr:hypothetical protein K438DRAFT_773819 [Mycena galopus ATCC 62051]